MPDESKVTVQENDTIPFYPDHVRTELRVVLGIALLAIFVGSVGLIHPVGLGEPADPLNTPAHVKPEWYFLSLYQVLKFIPKTVGALLPVVAVIVLTIWPFIDRRRDATSRIKFFRFLAVLVILFVIIALTIWGEVS